MVALNGKQPSRAGRDVKWIDGLRGLASVFIVSGHTMLSFDPQLVFPAHGDHDGPRLFQRPFLRLLCGQGPAWVALFFILTGFVNALKPIRLCEEGQVETALMALSLSAFRRSARLILPAAFVTVVVWALTQLHFFELGRNSDADWFRDNTPLPSSSLVEAIGSLLKNLVTTWTSTQNIYDGPQWTLTHLLRASFLTYTFLFSTAHTSRNWRLFICALCYAYFYLWKDPLNGVNTMFGIFLAGLSLRSSWQEFSPNNILMKLLLPAALIVPGLYLSSYPGDNHPEWAPWSRNLEHIGQYVFPAGAEQARFWPAVGMHLITFGVFLSPVLKRVLAHAKLVWLGNISFALYLLHGPLLRGVLAWILFGFSSATTREGTDSNGQKFTYQRYPLPPSYVFAIILPPFFAFVLWVSHLFTVYIDPLCATASKWLEDLFFGKFDEKELV